MLPTFENKLKKEREIANGIMIDLCRSFRMRMEIENIDKLGKRMVKLINKATDEDDRSNRETNVVMALGFYLGDELIQKNGGEWSEDNNGVLLVVLKNGTKVYPHDKIEKFILNGEADSLLALYKVSSMFG